jgi:hypothetical protein
LFDSPIKNAGGELKGMLGTDQISGFTQIKLFSVGELYYTVYPVGSGVLVGCVLAYKIGVRRSRSKIDTDERSVRLRAEVCEQSVFSDASLAAQQQRIVLISKKPCGKFNICPVISHLPIYIFVIGGRNKWMLGVVQYWKFVEFFAGVAPC